VQRKVKCVPKKSNKQAQKVDIGNCLYKKYLDFGRNIFILSKIGSPTLSSNFLA
jgi:hypothetical protein